MIEAVFTFAVITAIAELIMLHNMPRFRSFVLRTHGRMFALHITFMVANLAIHWGTMTGTMTGVTAFLVSCIVCQVARWMYGVRT